MHHPDICIAGAGIIGLSLGLELHRRGARVTILDQGAPASQASAAAAGMLAARDPHNPPQLQPLADLSLSLFPSYLAHIESLSGVHVPFHTSSTLQSVAVESTPPPDPLTTEELSHLLPELKADNLRFVLLEEHSIDPRELARALIASVRQTTIDLRPFTHVSSAISVQGRLEIVTSKGTLHPGSFVDCTGAWASTSDLPPHLQVSPRKGQILAVSLPPSLPLQLVLRTPEVYIVPRAAGPTPTRAIIGATVEDVGFDKTVHPADIAHLRHLAASLLPTLAEAPELETWAGLRPATPDGLPLLGRLPGQRDRFIATGHYRNGILLAPATAHIMAQLLSTETPSIDLAPYSADRDAAVAI